MRRKVKLKPRKHYVYKEDNKAIRKGRTYSDFLKYISSAPNTFVVQMDTIESKSSGNHKCLLTLHFTAHRFVLIFLLDSKTKDNVNNVFIHLKKTLGSDNFKKFFPVILTDRGSEFCSPDIIETDPDTGGLLTRVFFCDSYSSYQKGAIEETNGIIRYIVPEKLIFDHFTQESCFLIQSHVNSYYRKIIDCTPFHLALDYFGEDILNSLNCFFVEPKDIILSPKLF